MRVSSDRSWRGQAETSKGTDVVSSLYPCDVKMKREACVHVPFCWGLSFLSLRYSAPVLPLLFAGTFVCLSSRSLRTISVSKLCTPKRMLGVRNNYGIPFSHTRICRLRGYLGSPVREDGSPSGSSQSGLGQSQETHALRSKTGIAPNSPFLILTRPHHPFPFTTLSFSPCVANL